MKVANQIKTLKLIQLKKIMIQLNFLCPISKIPQFVVKFKNVKLELTFERRACEGVGN